eukprot:CAMPEP_0205925712 /NCGR_PEP_ID=MMETSP1325-20131115/18781_1 /ASSEMBLY_ACC=CAM_ASM_000708 /TAXON_ID=236786 /ORGANISM="Florenciella sp., Strain RCC1007" /LENGTH=92 /DNA_ID=CAMNT_0053294287 /DNA_START=117 /DNA_END=396 /DNA_ORIENTATION=+
MTLLRADPLVVQEAAQVSAQIGHDAVAPVYGLLELRHDDHIAGEVAIFRGVSSIMSVLLALKPYPTFPEVPQMRSMSRIVSQLLEPDLSSAL